MMYAKRYCSRSAGIGVRKKNKPTDHKTGRSASVISNGGLLAVNLVEQACEAQTASEKTLLDNRRVVGYVTE